jgi:hypothetical protein
VYIEDTYKPEVREAIAACCEDYFQRYGQHLRWALHPDTRLMERFGAGKGSNPRAWLPALGEEESFSLIYHGADWDRGAGAFSLKALGTERRPFTELGYLRVSFPVLWFSDHPGSLTSALLDICRRLRPVSGYGGIGVIESPDITKSQRYEPIVYELAQRFPGLEVDYPVSHSIWLAEGEGGIKGVNWLTVVGDRWLAKLGGTDAVHADLAALDRRFLVHRFDGGVMIQAGPRPELGDAESNDWPELYVKLSKYMEPIRIKRHRPFQHVDPGFGFDKERSEAWLRRFDDR